MVGGEHFRFSEHAQNRSVWKFLRGQQTNFFGAVWNLILVRCAWRLSASAPHEAAIATLPVELTGLRSLFAHGRDERRVVAGWALRNEDRDRLRASLASSNATAPRLHADR